MTQPATPRRRAGAWYWVLAGLVTAFGILAFWWHFVVLGYALFALGALRGRPAVFWPGLAGVVVFMAGFMLVSPLGCSTSFTETTSRDGVTLSSRGGTRCTNLVGIDYQGGTGYNPPLWPATVAGLGAGAVAAAAAWLMVAPRARR